jgi:hypothetical protein
MLVTRTIEKGKKVQNGKKKKIQGQFTMDFLWTR